MRSLRKTFSERLLGIIKMKNKTEASLSRRRKKRLPGLAKAMSKDRNSKLKEGCR